MWPRIWARKMSSVTFFDFKLVAADGSVGAAEVAGFPGFVQRAESGGNVLGQLRAGGGVDGIGAGECFHGAEVLQGPDDQTWLGQDRDQARREDGGEHDPRRVEML